MERVTSGLSPNRGEGFLPALSSLFGHRGSQAGKPMRLLLSVPKGLSLGKCAQRAVFTL